MAKVINFDEIRKCSNLSEIAKDILKGSNLSEIAKDILKDYDAVVILALHKDDLGFKMAVRSNAIPNSALREMLSKAIAISYEQDNEENIQ